VRLHCCGTVLYCLEFSWRSLVLHNTSHRSSCGDSNRDTEPENHNWATIASHLQSTE
jgi:hypothetical protein